MAVKSKSFTGADVVNDARRYLGIKYVLGGGPDNPSAGLDCSGLVERVAFDLGVNTCPRTSEQQWAWVKRVNTPNTGDLVFFVGAPEEAGIPGHVGIVVTPGTMIDAPHTGTVVQQQGYSNGQGENRIVGYGTMQGISPSSSPNSSYIAADQGGVAGSASTGAAVASIFGFIGILLVFGAIIGLLIFGIFLLTR